MNFVGPSYQLETRKADVQRSVNLYLSQVESGTGKSQFILRSVPGLALFSAFGATVRGCLEAAGRCFVVAGNQLFEVYADGATLARGTLLTSAGPVDMAQGQFQLVIVDGANGYVLTLASNAFGRITDPDWLGSDRVGFLDGYFVFHRPGSQQFYISAIDNASSLDALDFASAEGSPDELVALVVDHRELWLFGRKSIEVWYNAGGSDFPFSRNQGAFIELGCSAPFSAQKLDNSVFWLGEDSNGGGVVYRAAGYSPQRISTHAVEQALAKSNNLAGATAYTYQMDGHSFYVLQAPGLASTWVYDVAVGQWHERCDMIDGLQVQHRAHCHAYAFGKHLVGGRAALYEMRGDVNTNAGDPLIRERTSPHYATPALNRVYFGSFVLDCSTGEAATGIEPFVVLDVSSDGGRTFPVSLGRSLGKIGEAIARIEWNRMGQARDRVWRVWCTDDVPFSIIGAHVTMAEGKA